MRSFPSGLVTFMFTDIEGSTRLAQIAGNDWARLIAMHHELLGSIVERHGGVVVKTTGDGIFAAYEDATAAVSSAADIQAAVAGHSWPAGLEVRVRIGLHREAAAPTVDDYVSIGVHRAARIEAAAHGGQTLASTEVVDATELTRAIGTWSSLGAWRLRDFDDPVELIELVVAGLPARDFPALRAVPVAAHNVPTWVTPFIGRDRELAEVSQLLRQHQLVTIVAAGGSGKTRLAMQLATTVATEFPDGCFAVLLASVQMGEAARRIAEVVGVRQQSEVPLIELLCDRLRTQRTLLVIDNCEHLTEEVAQILGSLCTHCPRLQVVATSREPLGVTAEHVWRLPLFAVPETSVIPAQLASYDAVQLFLDRAIRADASFTLDESTAAAVARICRDLEGMPLAIELAAARLRHLPLQQLADRLGDRLRLLTGGARDLPQRQRTLRATLDWSYDLLDADEQQLFRQLAVFRSSFGLEAAESLVAGRTSDVDVLDVLSRLVDRSLLNVDDDGDQLRYRMLVVVAQYAEQRLVEAGEDEVARDRHARWAKAISWAELRSHRFAELPELFDDLSYAVEWALRHQHGELVSGLTASLYEYWAIRQTDWRGRELARRVLDQMPDLTPGQRFEQILQLAHDTANTDEDCEAALRELETLHQHAAADDPRDGYARLRRAQLCQMRMELHESRKEWSAAQVAWEECFSIANPFHQLLLQLIRIGLIYQENGAVAAEEYAQAQRPVFLAAGASGLADSAVRLGLHLDLMLARLWALLDRYDQAVDMLRSTLSAVPPDLKPILAECLAIYADMARERRELSVAALAASLFARVVKEHQLERIGWAWVNYDALCDEIREQVGPQAWAVAVAEAASGDLNVRAREVLSIELIGVRTPASVD